MFCHVRKFKLNRISFNKIFHNDLNYIPNFSFIRHCVAEIFNQVHVFTVCKTMKSLMSMILATDSNFNTTFRISSTNYLTKPKAKCHAKDDVNRFHWFFIWFKFLYAIFEIGSTNNLCQLKLHVLIVSKMVMLTNLADFGSLFNCNTAFEISILTYCYRRISDFIAA